MGLHLQCQRLINLIQLNETNVQCEITMEEYTCGMVRNIHEPHASFMGSIPHDLN